MMFLLRAAFWLSIVSVLLPTGGSKPAQQTASAESDISAVEAVSAASATMSDMRQFCARQPEACVLGAQAATAFGQRAQAGAKMVFEFISEKMISDTASTTAGVSTPAGHGVTKASADASRSQQTLTPADLSPVWRGSPPRKDVPAKRSV